MAQARWKAMAVQEVQGDRTSVNWTDAEKAAVHAGVAMYALFAAPRHMCSKQLVVHLALLHHPAVALYPGRHACLDLRMRCNRMQAVDNYGITHLRLGFLAGLGKGTASS